MSPDQPSPSGPEDCPNCGAPLPEHAPQGLCPKCLFAGLAVPTEDEAGAAGQAPPQPPEELAPHFPQLEILESLGRGGMGVVYKARQKLLNRFVALKLLAPERVADAKFAQRFTHEAQALAALNHPNIVTIYDFGQAGGFYFLLMEFVDGVNLRQAMKAGRFTPEQALAVVPPVCEALQYAHEHGIVHRDIKPENLLLDKEGRVKIADFGIAKMLGSEADTTVRDEGPQAGTLASVAGTPQYMAPEQKEHRATDHRADIYSLGVVLYELLTGELPAEKLQPPSCKVQIDVRLDEIVLRALEKTPALRYQSAGEFRTQVETVTGTRIAHPTEPSVTPVPSRFSRAAIWAAAWITLSAFVVPPFIWHEVKTHEFENGGPFFNALTALVFFLFLMPAFSAPVGATLLGWIGVTQIRHSAGKLYGLALAVFDALLFPLLVLDVLLWDVASRALILFSNWQAHAISQRVQESAPDPGRTFDLIDQLHAHAWLQGVEWDLFRWIMLAVVVFVDWLIIRWVWRAVKRSAHPGTGLGSAPSLAEPSVTRPRRDRPASGIVALSLAIAGLFMVGLFGLLDWSALADLPRLEEYHPSPPWRLPVSPALLFACGLLACFLEIPALVLGVRARRTAFGKAATMVALVAIALPVAGFVEFSDTRHRLVQADLDRRGVLTGQMGEAIDQHLTAARLVSAVLSFSFSSDGDYATVQLQDVTSTEPGRKKVVAEGRIHGLDRGRGDWWVQGEGPLGHIAFSLAGQALSHDANERFSGVPGEPYPVRTLVRASDGTTFAVPDLAAYLPQVRRLPAYAEWRKVRGIETLHVTNRSDYRCEVQFGGQMPDASGQRRDWITEIDLLRPDRTRLARIDLGPPDQPRPWSTSLFDGTGERELVRVLWKSGNLETEGVIESIIRDPGQPAEMPWSVSQGRTIEDKTHAFVAPPTEKGGPEGVLEQIEHDSPTTAGTVADSETSVFAPVIEREVDGALDLDTGKVAALPENFGESNDLAARVLKGVAWLERERMDAVTEPSGELKGVDLKAKTVDKEAWDRFTPDQVVSTLEEAKREIWQNLDPNRHTDEDRKTPATWAFETREGGQGLLQLLENSEHGVKVRYKLVQRGPASADGTQVPISPSPNPIPSKP